MAPDRPVDKNGHLIERRSGWISPRRYFVAWVVSFGVLALGVIGLYLQAVGLGQEQRERVETESMIRDRELEEESRRADIEICESANENRELLRDFIIAQYRQSLRNLETLDYYIEHPDEAEQVRAQTLDALERVEDNFAPANCNTLPTAREEGDQGG